MKCQNCNEREANTHIQKIINGKKTEYHLCEKCASELGDFSFSFSDDFDNFFGNFFNTSSKNLKMPVKNLCPECQMSLRDFSTKGLLGCGKCYESFKEALSKPLRQIHGSVSHTGKIPQKSMKKISTKQKIQKLQAELDAAVSNQEFEKAATLRDKILELQKGANE